MKLTNKIIGSFVLLLSLFTSCGFDKDLNVNPNKPASFETRFLYLAAVKDVYKFNWTAHPFMNNWYQLYPHYLADAKEVKYTSFSNQNITTIHTFVGGMKNLNTIATGIENKEIDLTGYSGLGDKENQIGVALTLKAFYMMHLTDQVGMLPYTEAYKRDEKNYPIFQMKYDTQEEIYTQLFKELNEAYARFDDSKRLNAEYEKLYQGDISKWKKYNASLRMMMAIKLQNAAPEQGKKEFQKAFEDKAIEDNSANLVFTFLDELSGNSSWLFQLYGYFKNFYYAPCETLVEQMKTYNDPRISSYFEPNNEGQYVGAILGWSADELASSKRNFCRVHKKYWEKKNAPMTITSAANTLFMEAEAALIGWINADPAALYKEAIKASFIQHEVDLSTLDAYLNQPEVAFEGEHDQKIKKIAMQKWIAGYLQDGIEAWSDWRRFKYPELTAGKEGESVGGLTKGLPLRMTYAENEIKYNKENYKRVLEIQGEDHVYTPLWWNK